MTPPEAGSSNMILKPKTFFAHSELSSEKDNVSVFSLNQTSLFTLTMDSEVLKDSLHEISLVGDEITQMLDSMAFIVF